ncbi:uncharacterized protein [Euwallacea similis]|uniref:uncharacterized protein n=1 Tax=Euwallacea similis TaxID=1736056 RepID=UPI00344D9DD3
MSPVRRCNEVEAVQIVTLHNKGYTQKDIAYLRSQSIVSNILKKYQKTGNFEKFKTDRFKAKTSCYSSSASPKLQKASIIICQNTRSVEYRAVEKIMFTDETRIQLWKPNGRNYVYRRVGERYVICSFTHSVSFGGDDIMLWGGISWEGRTDLVEVIGRLTAEMYIEKILQDHVVPYIGHIGYEKFVLTHDNARPHAAGVVLKPDRAHVG